VLYLAIVNLRRLFMITGELKNKVDKIWETFWTGGITNPLSVIEQITYLLFIKGLDEAETIKEKEASLLGIDFERTFPEEKQQLRWSQFKNMEAEQMYQVMAEGVFPFIKNLHNDKESAYSKYMSDAIFMIPTPKMLEKVVTGLDSIPMQDRDTKGDLYEYLLSKIATAGKNGQFRTPRHIIEMMVKLMKPTPEDKIVDPAAGSSGFLVAASEYLREKHEDLFLDKDKKDHFNNSMFYGYDMDRTMLRIGAMNMMLHGIDNPNIEYRDSLSELNEDREEYSLILANPPFKGSLDYDVVADDLLKLTKTKKTELLFLSLFTRILKVGGRCASIVPDGVLFGSSRAHKAIRKELVENQKLEAIISMPSGVFKPYAGVSTAIIIFTKTNAGGTDKVWFYDMKADGYSLDDKRQPIEENDIPDILERFNNLAEEEGNERTEKSFLVPKSEIKEMNYDLSINRYKEIEYEEIEYEKPIVIIEEIERLEEEIISGLAELKGMIG
jgi:type I restriction enzyme M protein